MGERTERGTAQRGRFLVLDGVDGCGKSTQAARLVERLARSGREPLHVREPGSTALGEALRALLLQGEEELSASVEALLFAAARRHLLEELVAPALSAGRDVVCERFHPSTYAYQGVAGGVGPERVLALLAEWADEPRPDLVLVLELAPEIALARRGSTADRIESRDADYQRKVAEGFRRYATGRSGVVRVDASRAPDDVERAVWEEVQRASG